MQNSSVCGIIKVRPCFLAVNDVQYVGYFLIMSQKCVLSVRIFMCNINFYIFCVFIFYGLIKYVQNASNLRDGYSFFSYTAIAAQLKAISYLKPQHKLVQAVVPVLSRRYHCGGNGYHSGLFGGWDGCPSSAPLSFLYPTPRSDTGFTEWRR